MDQLDRIEAKLTRLLEIAEKLLAKSGGELQGSLIAAGASETLQILNGEAGKSVIDEEQNIQELFAKYPAFREDFYKLDHELAGLKGPAGMGMLKDATVGMIAKSLRIDTDGFVSKVNDVLASYQ